MRVRPMSTVKEINFWVFFKTGYRVAEWYIIFTGRHLDQDLTLKDYNIKNETTVHILKPKFGK